MIRVACHHARDIGRPGAVECALGLFGGRPHAGVCLHCVARNKELTTEEAALIVQESRTEHATEPATARMDCRHLGPATGALVECPTCSGSVKLKLFNCAVFGSCTVQKPVANTHCCRGCELYDAVTNCGGVAQEVAVK